MNLDLTPSRQPLVHMLRTSALVLVLVFSAAGVPEAHAADDPGDTLEQAIRLVGEFVRSGDPNVPPAVVADAEAVIVVPGFKRFGIALFGMYQGLGLMLVRANDGSWSDPVFVYVDGGSIGAQLGMETVDFVVAVTSRERVVSLMRGTSFGVGGEVTAGRAGAGGSTVTARPDIYLHARSRGGIVGFGIRGSTLHVDDEANEAFYGADLRLLEVLTGRLRVRSEEVRRLQELLREFERS